MLGVLVEAKEVCLDLSVAAIYMRNVVKYPMFTMLRLLKLTFYLDFLAHHGQIRLLRELAGFLSNGTNSLVFFPGLTA